mgnify:CR=1 FL=1
MFEAMPTPTPTPEQALSPEHALFLEAVRLFKRPDINVETIHDLMADIYQSTRGGFDYQTDRDRFLKNPEFVEAFRQALDTCEGRGEDVSYLRRQYGDLLSEEN